MEEKEVDQELEDAKIEQCHKSFTDGIQITQTTFISKEILEERLARQSSENGAGSTVDMIGVTLPQSHHGQDGQVFDRVPAGEENREGRYYKMRQNLADGLLAGVFNTTQRSLPGRN